MKKEIVAEGVDAVPGILSQAIEAGGLVFVSGQIHITADGQVLEGSVEEKIAQIMANASKILGAAGLTLDNVVKASIFVTNLAQMPEVNKFYPTYFTAPYPAREAIGVKELPLGATIEISMIAVR